MSAITKEERQAWREACERALPTQGTFPEEDVIRLLDALDASEQRVAALERALEDTVRRLTALGNLSEAAELLPNAWTRAMREQAEAAL